MQSVYSWAGYVSPVTRQFVVKRGCRYHLIISTPSPHWALLLLQSRIITPLILTYICMPPLPLEKIFQITPVDPFEVHLSVDGKTDKCSRGEDIDFELQGFSIYGQVRFLGPIRPSLPLCTIVLPLIESYIQNLSPRYKGPIAM